MARILATSRSPVLPQDCPHSYSDKYRFAECLTNTALAGLLNCLEFLGLDAAGLGQLQGWAASGSAVTLRFRCAESSARVATTSREQEGPTRVTIAMGGTAAYRCCLVYSIHDSPCVQTIRSSV